MNKKTQLSEEELQALLGLSEADSGEGGNADRTDGDAGAVRSTTAEPEQALLQEQSGARRLPLHDADTQEGELLQALKEVVKTLTVRVASLESEVGRLRADLASSRGELVSPEPRIVVEGVTLPSLLAEQEAAPAAEAVSRLEGASTVTSVSDVQAQPEARPQELGTNENGFPAVSDGPQQPGAASIDEGLTTRASRHRKPKKKGFFAKLFQ